ncbi:hypothetical protein DdX_11366 [Ditylenchus destructor]|uniref:Uncharacterized protein n=1 Tax=Ditylenchus destructor TaxID=166010 RepID=A0AAD4MY74_9BILA|nr:hypothetical protein DdX_11366 [Ditylenchus destructor]
MARLDLNLICRRAQNPTPTPNWHQHKVFLQNQSQAAAHHPIKRWAPLVGTEHCAFFPNPRKWETTCNCTLYRIHITGGEPNGQQRIKQRQIQRRLYKGLQCQRKTSCMSTPAYADKGRSRMPTVHSLPPKPEVEITKPQRCAVGHPTRKDPIGDPEI